MPALALLFAVLGMPFQATPQTIADNPSIVGDCYTSNTGPLVITTTTFAQCDAKHGMWHRQPEPKPVPVLPDSAKYGPGATPASEPFDVPAVQVEQDDVYAVCSPCPSVKHGTKLVWTCADPRRVLLTSEDGKRHCVLLEGK